MTHPEDLLADYVDGSLRDQERAAVDAHLETCPVCREEIELARAAVTALATLEEVPVPLGVTGPILAESGKRFERRRVVAWRRLQWAAGAAAAAALVLVVGLNLTDLGSGDGANRATVEAAGGGSAASGPAAELAAPQAALPSPGLQRQPDVNYDDAGVRSLAEDAAKERSTAGASADTALAASTDALRCLRASGAPVGQPDYQLVRLVEAKFKGTPAFFGVFLQSPGAGQPADHAIVWVSATNDCRILDQASLPI